VLFMWKTPDTLKWDKLQTSAVTALSELYEKIWRIICFKIFKAHELNERC
jgi:hypothetical protein